MIDYAHNPHGIAAICDLVEDLRGSGDLVAILGIAGDRRDEDIRQCAHLVAKTFDRAIVREDDDLRGRRTGEVAELLRHALLASGMSTSRIETRLDEADALRLAIERGGRGDLIVHFAEHPAAAAMLAEDLRRVRVPAVR